MSWGWDSYGEYVSADEKRRRAEKAARDLQKKGRKLAPVRLAGRNIASSFWGKAWCKNLESYSDYEYRLPRGRSYLRNGAVLDLQITRGAIAAMVFGTELYTIKIAIEPVRPADWKALKAECAGRVGSLMELLQGKLSAPVMEIIARKETGLFPKPREIRLKCSCPDAAEMCKHVAAAMYAVGARLDEAPELLFELRGADHRELIVEAVQSLTAEPADSAASPSLAGGSLSEVFGIEIDDGSADGGDVPPPAKKRRNVGKPAAAASPKRPVKSKRPTSKPVGKSPSAAPKASAKRLPKKPARRKPAHRFR